jgi:hypothetical protein
MFKGILFRSRIIFLLPIMQSISSATATLLDLKSEQ